MAKKGGVQKPSTSLVKYLNIAAAGIGIVSVLLDALVPVAQQLGKKSEARQGLERAISLTIFLTLIRATPRFIGQVRKLQAQLAAEVAG